MAVAALAGVKAAGIASPPIKGAGVGKAKPAGIAPLLGQSAGAARGDWAGRG